MESSTHILVVDDEIDMVKLVSTVLIGPNNTISTAEDGTRAIEIIREQPIDLVILDMMMPGMDGLQVCREVRKRSGMPIIILSALSDETRIVQALDAGADDYLVKPFRVRELRARIRAVLRRNQPFSAEPILEVFEHANLKIDLINREVTVDGVRIHMTPTEFALLRTLTEHPNRLIPHRTLLEWVWGDSYADAHHLLHINVNRLRFKLSGMQSAEIITEPAAGYMLKLLLPPVSPLIDG